MQTINDFSNTVHLRVWFLFCGSKPKNLKRDVQKSCMKKLAIAAAVAASLKGKYSYEVRIKEGEQKNTHSHSTTYELNFEWAREHEICIILWVFVYATMMLFLLDLLCVCYCRYDKMRCVLHYLSSNSVSQSLFLCLILNRFFFVIQFV